MHQRFSIQQLAYLLIVICLIVYILTISTGILVPLVFAGFFTFMLKPICDFCEKYTKSRLISIFLSFIIALIPVFGIITLFTAQSVEVFKDMPAISGKIKIGVDKIIAVLNNSFGLTKAEGQQWLSEHLGTALDTPLQIVGGWLSSSSTLLLSIFLLFLYTFFFLLYRTSIKNFLLIQFSKKKRTAARHLIREIQSVAQQYLYGIFMVVGILGLLNSIGLWLIGIEYAFFWGFLGAFLAIIPYIGAFMGGLLPFIYAFATAESMWQPVAVIILYAVVQAIEGNLITPKVVGSSVEINPLTAIISLLVGGSIWGISGLILALPIIAVIRIIFEHIDILKPIGLLLSHDLYEDRDKFLEEYDEEKYRLSNFFNRKEE